MTSSMTVWTQAFIGSKASDEALHQSRLMISVVSRSLKLSLTHPSFHSLDSVTSAVGLQSYEWARFLTQSKVITYYDNIEQLGVQLGDAEAQVECGEEIWQLCGGLEHIDENIVRRPL